MVSTQYELAIVISVTVIPGYLTGTMIQEGMGSEERRHMSTSVYFPCKPKPGRGELAWEITQTSCPLSSTLGFVFDNYYICFSGEV